MAPVMTEDSRMMLRTLPDNLLGSRDRALLLIGFAGAFRRSGARFARRCRSKTDQDGEGRPVAIPHGTHEQTCPVRAAKAWLGQSGISEGAVFRPVNRHGKLAVARLSDQAIALVVKRCAGRVGMTVGSFAGHSLRAEFVTSARSSGRTGAAHHANYRAQVHRNGVALCAPSERVFRQCRSDPLFILEGGIGTRTRQAERSQSGFR